MDFANEARVEISTLCNHNCIFCTHDLLTRRKEVMSDKTFILVMSEIKKENSIDQITLSGFGESFTDSKVLDRIEAVKLMGYKVNILTNGTLLTSNIIDRLVELKVDSLRISVHADNPDDYDRIVGVEDKFYTLTDNLEYIAENKGDMKFTITNVLEDEDKLNHIVECFEPLCDNLEIWRPHNWGDKLEYRHSDWSKKTCGRLNRGPLQVMVDGTVNTCCFDYDGRLTIGDLTLQTIEEIFTGEEYLKIKEMHDTGKYDDIICKNCDQRIEYDGLIYSSIGDDRTNKFSSSLNERIK